MTRELLGQTLGWLAVTVAAWFLALLLMAYGLGDIRPWLWSVGERFTHLLIQLGLIIAYARWARTIINAAD